MGNEGKRVKIWKVLLLEVFLLVGFLTELFLYMSVKSFILNSAIVQIFD